MVKPNLVMVQVVVKAKDETLRRLRKSGAVARLRRAVNKNPGNLMQALTEFTGCWDSERSKGFGRFSTQLNLCPVFPQHAPKISPPSCHAWIGRMAGARRQPILLLSFWLQPSPDCLRLESRVQQSCLFGEDPFDLELAA